MPRSAGARYETIAELLEQLGDIGPRRVRLHPPPGKATERDLVRLHVHTDRLYELVGGTLVEKIMGYPESSLPIRLGRLLGNFVEEHDLGNLAGADGGMRLMPGVVRLPDLSFISWDRLPGREVPAEAVAGLAPDLAVEVLSEGNTPKEMGRKLKEYFLSGVRLVWFIDLDRRTVEVFTAPDESVVLGQHETLDGGDVLPGLALPVREIFARIPRTSTRRKPRRARKRNGRGK